MKSSLLSNVLYITVIGLALVSFTEQNSFKLAGNLRILQAGRQARARIQTSRPRNPIGRMVRSLFKNISRAAPKRAAGRAAKATRKAARATRKILPRVAAVSAAPYAVPSARTNYASNRAKQLARNVADAKTRDQKDKKWKRKLKKHLATETPGLSSSIERIFYDADKYSHVGSTDKVTKFVIPL
jgi:hypothetical protein